ncbi:hypothetical protein JOL79_13275 [Microbispora sp. RL4-1S]|uniref:DUF1453 domain-containing protein n=1 Tax=Microbispora oryzae TaxID=2806554 RepID=A0A941AI41_9ACTN|nr:hypothetical protein [Microbispora oryzae]MBP2704785.1 hypothetical protein [Microbispora oryzae]
MDISNVVLIVAAVAFVIYRQTATRPTERRGALYVCAAMVLYSIAGGGLVDPRHTALSVGLLAAELILAVALGAVRALTVRVWRDETGVAWARGTAWTFAAWAGSIAARVVLYALGQAAGVNQPTNALFFFVGITLGTQALLVARRGRALPAPAVRRQEPLDGSVVM